jgi:hypothetical protein
VQARLVEGADQQRAQPARSGLQVGVLRRRAGLAQASKVSFYGDSFVIALGKAQERGI